MRIRHLSLLLVSVALAGCATQQASTDVNTAVASESASSDAELSIRNYLSARFAASEYDMSEAARFYRATLSRDPENKDLLSAAFFYSSYAGDLDGAAKLAQQIIIATPTDRTARLILSLAAIKQRNYAEARKHLAASPSTNAGSGLTLAIFNAWAAAGQRDRVTAENDLKSLSAINGGSALAAINRAFILDVIGVSATDVEAGYKEALIQNPTNQRLIDSYGRFLERAGRTQDANALYARFEANPGVQPVLRAAKARLASGRKPDKLVRTASEGAAEALVSIASNLSDPDSVEAAIFYLRMSLYLRPNFDFASVILGARFEGIKKFDAANAAYAAVAKDSPYFRMASIEMAMNDARLERIDDAIAKLKSLTEANPADIEVLTSLGDVYRNAERYGEAAAVYDRAIAQLGPLKQRDWALYYSRAMARERNKNWPEAEADLKKALELSPNEPQVMNYLGYSWIEQRQNLTEALAMLEKARSLRPFDGYIVDSVGWAYYQLGRYEEAAKALQDAVQLVPGDSTINDHLGDALWRIGRKLDARFQWNHALTFGPEPQERASIEKKLQSGLAATDAQG